MRRRINLIGIELKSFRADLLITKNNQQVQDLTQPERIQQKRAPKAQFGLRSYGSVRLLETDWKKLQHASLNFPEILRNALD